MVTMLVGYTHNIATTSQWRVSRLQDVASKHKERQGELDSVDMPKVSHGSADRDLDMDTAARQDGAEVRGTTPMAGEMFPSACSFLSSFPLF
jgi:hypothetical protein